MQTIAVDMDGVLADVYQQFIDWHQKECGELLAVENLRGMSESAAFPFLLKHVNAPGFFRDAPLIEDAVRVMEQLNLQYEVFVVSAAMEFPGSLSEKQAWLNAHFPFISWQKMVFCGSKKIINTDIMIDDHFKNLDHFHGKTYLFTQPHNQNAPDGKHQRVNSWAEIKARLIV